MIQQLNPTLSEMYQADETAWLEAMAELIQLGRLSDLDYAHLQEYLTDMAGRDRREVASRLKVLISHVLKWVCQPERRSRGWRVTILDQQEELSDLASTGVLRNHAEAILHQVYPKAVNRAATETELPTSTFPSACPYTLEQLFSADLLQE